MSAVLDKTNKVYFHGRWALETLNMNSWAALNMTYGKAERHKVFIIEKIEEDTGISNRSTRLQVDGVLGLSRKTDSKATYESYGEYLKRRKLI